MLSCSLYCTDWTLLLNPSPGWTPSSAGGKSRRSVLCTTNTSLKSILRSLHLLCRVNLVERFRFAHGEDFSPTSCPCFPQVLAGRSYVRSPSGRSSCQRELAPRPSGARRKHRAHRTSIIFVLWIVVCSKLVPHTYSTRHPHGIILYIHS